MVNILTGIEQENKKFGGVEVDGVRRRKIGNVSLVNNGKKFGILAFILSIINSY